MDQNIEQERIVGLETPRVESTSTKIFRYFFFFLYFATFAPFVIIMTVPSGLGAMLIVTPVIIGLPFYINYKDKKRLEIPESERARITQRKNRVALIIVVLFLLYAIYNLYREGGSFSSIFSNPNFLGFFIE